MLRLAVGGLAAARALRCRVAEMGRLWYASIVRCVSSLMPGDRRSGVRLLGKAGDGRGAADSGCEVASEAVGRGGDGRPIEATGDVALIDPVRSDRLVGADCGLADRFRLIPCSSIARIRSSSMPPSLCRGSRSRKSPLVSSSFSSSLVQSCPGFADMWCGR